MDCAGSSVTSGDAGEVVTGAKLNTDVRLEAVLSQRATWYADIGPADHWGWYVRLGFGVAASGGPRWSPTLGRAERWARRQVDRKNRRAKIQEDFGFRIGQPFAVGDQAPHCHEPQPRPGVEDPVTA